jgi:hypothetical protein
MKQEDRQCPEAKYLYGHFHLPCDATETLAFQWTLLSALAINQSVLFVLPPKHKCIQANCFSVWPEPFCLLVCCRKTSEIRIYKTIILPVVLYWYETWSLSLREEHRLRVFENRVLRRIFGPKTDEMTGEWRTRHNEEFNDFYSLPSTIRIIKSRRMRWVGHVTRIIARRQTAWKTKAGG